MRKKGLFTRVGALALSCVMVLGLINVIPSEKVEASETSTKTPYVTYSLDTLNDTEVISDITFMNYAATFTAPKEESGTIVVANTTLDTIKTSDILTAYETFLTNQELTDVSGLVIEGTEVEITGIMDIPYLEIQGDTIWFGSLHTEEDEEEDEDEEEIDELSADETPVVESNNNIYLNAPVVSLDNTTEAVWNVNNLDIYTDDVALQNSPIVSNSINIIGLNDSIWVEIGNSEMYALNIDFQSIKENYEHDAYSVNSEGNVINLSKYFAQIGVAFTVTFDANGGECETTTLEEHYMFPVENLPVPTREGYTFNGWFTSANGGIQITEGGEHENPYTFTEDVTLYAQWTPNEYTVTLIEDVENAENTTTTETVSYDEVCSFLPVLEKEGYIFKGWTDNADVLLTNADKYTITGDITLYPKWKLSNCPHENTEIINAKETNCKEEGYTGDTYCNDCEETVLLGSVIVKSEHGVTELRNAKETSCKEAGYTGDACCTVCDEVLEAGEEITKESHTWDAGTVIKVPTYTSQGKKHYTCTVCGEVTIALIDKLEEDKTTEQPTTQTPTTEQPKTETPTTEQPTTQAPTTEQPTTEAVKDYSKQIAAAKKKKVKISKVTNVKGRKIKVKVKKASGYKFQIKISTSKKFKKSVKTYKTSKATYTAKKKFTKGKTYYVKVRTYKKINGKTYYGKWSTIKKVKIKK